MRRPCLIPGCSSLIESGKRCPIHGTRKARGYGAAHERARRALVNSLPLDCAYCGGIITTPDHLVAAHVIDGNPTAGWMPSHPLCNERAKRR